MWHLRMKNFTRGGTNVSRIFEYILKLQIFVITMLLYAYYIPTFIYKLTERSLDKLATSHSISASRSFSRTVRGKLISAISTTTRRFYVFCVDRGRILTKDS